MEEQGAAVQGADESQSQAQVYSTCDNCGSLYTEGLDGIDGRCALELRSIAVWGRANSHLRALVSNQSTDQPKRWRIVER